MLTLHALSPEPLGAAILLSIRMNVSTLSTSYMWTHTVFVLWWLAYFARPDVLKGHPYCNMGPSFQSWIISQCMYRPHCVHPSIPPSPHPPIPPKNTISAPTTSQALSMASEVEQQKPFQLDSPRHFLGYSRCFIMFVEWMYDKMMLREHLHVLVLWLEKEFGG